MPDSKRGPPMARIHVFAPAFALTAYAVLMVTAFA